HFARAAPAQVQPGAAWQVSPVPIAPRKPFANSFLISSLPSQYRLKNQLLFAGFKVVVIPELLAGDDLLDVIDAALWIHVVDFELPREPFAIERGHFSRHSVDAERTRFTTQIDRSVVHGVAEVLSRVTEDHHAAALHHEAGEGTGIAAHNDRAALLID